MVLFTVVVHCRSREIGVRQLEGKSPRNSPDNEHYQPEVKVLAHLLLRRAPTNWCHTRNRAAAPAHIHPNNANIELETYPRQRSSSFVLQCSIFRAFPLWPGTSRSSQSYGQPPSSRKPFPRTRFESTLTPLFFEVAPDADRGRVGWRELHLKRLRQK